MDLLNGLAKAARISNIDITGSASSTLEWLKDPLVDHAAEQAKKKQRRFTQYACVVIIVLMWLASVWWLQKEGLHGWFSTVDLGTKQMLLFHVGVAFLGTIPIVHQLTDPVAVAVRYQLPGDTSTPVAEYSFIHAGRLTAFTTWCSIIAVAYFWLAALACALSLWHRQQLPPWEATAPMPPLANLCIGCKALTMAMGVLWDIAFPMSFLVNIMVSFVIIPLRKKSGDYTGLWYMLRWRGQALHNGYVLVSALEACIVRPEIPYRGFPVIVVYGIAYVLFSYVLFAKTGVYHYFFLDPRWKFAPFSLLGLLTLLTAVYFLGSLAIGVAAHSMLGKGLLIFAALATCTFYDRSAVAPETVSAEISLFGRWS